MIKDNIHIKRDALIQNALESLSNVQVLLIQAPGGFGKSVLAVDIIEEIKDKTVIAFRASEFASAHFDNVLASANINCNAEKFFNILKLQDEKYLYIDGFERLLEISDRNALDDLLQYLSKDKSLKVIITCRDYRAEMVKCLFFEHNKISSKSFTVPKLSKSEISNLLDASIALSINDRLLEILRIPYLLYLFFLIDWRQTLPSNFNEYKTQVWERLIRGDVSIDRAPARREALVINIAHKRALALSEYVVLDDQDFTAVEGLLQSAVLTCNPNNENLIKLSHDVMEDWALVKLFDRWYQECHNDYGAFIARISMHPAIRRAYRVWLNEFIDQHLEDAIKLYDYIYKASDLPAYLKDDSYVALMQSSYFAIYAIKNKESIFNNNNEFLVTLIKLMLISRVTDSPILPKPIGKSWTTVCQLSRENIHEFKEHDLHLVTRLITIWSNLITFQNPYPDGSKDVSAIICYLLSKSSEYDTNHSRLLETLGKIPLANDCAFVAYVNRILETKQNHDEIYKIIFDSPATMALARDLPKFVESLFWDAFIIRSPIDKNDFWANTSVRNPEYYFGVDAPFNALGHPASALRGPFIWLLKFHFEFGLKFILGLIDYCTEWNYAIEDARYTPKPNQIILMLNGDTISQLSSETLWMAYRGTVVFPEPLQCALMALEHYLLDMVDSRSPSYDTLLTTILKQTKSAAVSAVIASCCCANIVNSKNTLLALLHSKDFIMLDFQRKFRESQVLTSPILDFRNHDISNLYWNERKRAKERDHRQIDLQFAALSMQYSGYGDEVWNLIDEHSKRIDMNQPIEDTAPWRLALARMDARKISVSPVSGSDNGLVQLEVTELDEELREMSVQAHEDMKYNNEKLSFHLWAQRAFEGKDVTNDETSWKQYLAKYRIQYANLPERVLETDVYELFERDALLLLIGVCVRDHWDELSQEDVAWCVDILLDGIACRCNSWNYIETIQRQLYSYDRIAAHTLPVIYSKLSNLKLKGIIFDGMVLACTHAIDEVRICFCYSLSKNCDKNTNYAFLTIINHEAILLVKNFKWNKIFQTPNYSFDVIGYATAIRVRNKVERGNSLDNDIIFNLSIHEWISLIQFSQVMILAINMVDNKLISDLFSRFVRFLIDDWEAHQGKNKNFCRFYEQISAGQGFLIDYLLNLRIEETESLLTILLSSVDKFPREIGNFIVRLLAKSYTAQKLELFWNIWDIIVEKVLNILKFTSTINSRYYHEETILAALFLNPLLGSDFSVIGDEIDNYGSSRMTKLFDKLPTTKLSVSNYIKYLFYAGKESFPDSLSILSERLSKTDYTNILSDPNILFLLEGILRKQLYTVNPSIRQNHAVRDHVLRLFDMMVECGSSQAFFMRDDFVLPLSTANRNATGR